jgi:hypothetical protein
VALVLLLLAAACGGEAEDDAAAPRDCVLAWNGAGNPNRPDVPPTMGAAGVVRANGGCTYVFHDWGRYVSYGGRWTDEGLAWDEPASGDWTAARQRAARDDYVVGEGGGLRSLAVASREWGRWCLDVGAHGGRAFELCRVPARPGVQTRWTNSGALVVEEGGVRKVVHVEPPQRPGAKDGPPIVGHWERAILSPDGRNLLLLWSGECETRFTFVASASGGAPRAALRAPGAWWEAPSSTVVGWESARVAVVKTVPGCGSRAEERRIRVSLDR